MKKITTILVAILLTASVFAQAPQKMTYQAVVRNSSNALVQSSPVGMKVSILQGSVTGTAVYVETHTTQTNQNGLLDIQIGGGTIVSGTYINGIYWAAGPYFLKTEIDPSGGTNYSITSTSELLSVPYSIYSLTAGNLIAPFIGAYLEASPALLWSPAFITYLDGNKVLLKLNFQLRTDIDPNNTNFEYTWCGVISGNTITFPQNLNLGNSATMSGTGNGGTSLTLTLFFASDPSYIYTFNLVRQ